MIGDPTRAMWLAAGLILVLVYSLVVHPAEESIAQNGDQTTVLVDRALREQAGMLAAVKARALERRVNADLAHVAIHSSAGSASAGLLAELQALAQRVGVELIDVHPRALETLAKKPAATPAETDAQGVRPRDAFDVVARGPYARMVGFIHDASTIRTLARVTSVDLERTAANTRGAGDSDVNGTLTLEVAYRGGVSK